jgi:hypothetical protein
MKNQDNQTLPTKKSMRDILSIPWLASLLYAIAFFILYLFVFRPGYQVDDDITMIQLVSGYFGKPVPFMVFSNVILGFLLNLLYRLPTNLNWEILIFFGINFLSVWCLVTIALSMPLKFAYRFFGILVILASDSLFLLNVTFTMIAAFAAISGFVSILAATYNGSRFSRRMLIFGGLLVLAGSLIRVESFLLVLLMIFPSWLFICRFFDLKKLSISLLAAIFAVALFYLFNTIYVKSSPQWDSFYTYDNVRSQLQDTPRIHLLNDKNIYSDVGWNFNDYKLFVNWFFPDEQLFSLSNLQYLVSHVPGAEKNVLSAAASYFYPKPFFDDVDSFPYFFMMAAGLLAAAIYPSFRKAVWPLVILWLTFLILIFYLIWTEKIPVHVWDSFLATACVFGLFILLWVKSDDLLRPRSRRTNVFAFIVPGLLCAAGLYALYYAFVTTQLNAAKQTAYQSELSDLKTLQAQGKIQSNALIVSPALGIPLIWSNPMVLDFPSAKYVEMGWLTFSPSYYDVLHEFDVQSLPAGFYQNDNVYLMVKANLRDSVVEFIADHAGVTVAPRLIYSPPNYDFDSDYNNVRLFQLILQK